jgi:UDP-N-acetylmuramoylalanine--D-glutamate ligase
MKLSFALQQRYGVFGLGKSGLATARALREGGAEVFAWDDNPAHVAALQHMLPHCHILPPDAWPWTMLAALVLSPGVPLTHPKPHPVVTLAKAQQIPIIGDLELLYRAQPEAKYIAITGTNGKSTTTSLIGHILRAQQSSVEVGGNLGQPVLEFAPANTYVLEASSYQLDLLEKTRFNIAILLNFSPDHLDRHGDMAGYIAAKRHIFDRQQKGDVAILGVDDPASESVCRAMIAASQQRVIPISGHAPVKDGVFVQHGVLHNRLSDSEITVSLEGIKSLQGAHNWQNAAAAYAALFSYGMAHEAIIVAMQQFPGLAHRMQWLGTRHGVQYVNDSKATNADAAEKALLTYDRIYWILGGVPKAGGIAPLASYFPKICHAYLIGEAAADFAKTLGGAVPHTACGTLERAFAAAREDAEREGLAGAVVLLSPACASFDQFKNFEARGDRFLTLFEEI